MTATWATLLDLTLNRQLTHRGQNFITDNADKVLREQSTEEANQEQQELLALLIEETLPDEEEDDD